MENQTVINKTVKSGITFGSALAMVISYTTWHSVGWAILHGLMSFCSLCFCTAAMNSPMRKLLFPVREG